MGKVAGLSVSRHAGLIDHYSLREYYRKEARSRGVKFIDRCCVKEMVLHKNTVAEIRAYDLKNMRREQFDKTLQDILIEGVVHSPADTMSIECGTLINTAGAWAPRIAEMYGFTDTDVKPRRRQMVVINCHDVDLSSYGMIIDTSNIYFHKEAQNILAGYSNTDEPYGYNFEFSFGGSDHDSSFVKYIWKPLWSRIGGFERVKFIRGWAGIYAETPDRSGYLGKVPGTNNVYECIAHTGRGLMISYGAAVALADLIFDGTFREELKHAFDLSRSRPSGSQYEGLHL